MDVLRDMALFVEVAKTKSIKKAAEALSMPDSTLSRRITGLERSLGLRLLNRSTRRISLTEAGMTYFSQCQQIVEAAKLAQERLKEMVESPQGLLRLSLPVDFSTLFLAPMIGDFLRLYPKITFDLQLSENWLDLAQEGFDLSIRIGRQPDSTVTARHIADIRYGLYASPDYLHLAGTPKHPRDLADHTCIRMVCPHWDETWTLAGPGEVMRVNVNTRVSANNVALVRRFAILGAGIAPLDQLLGGEDAKAGRLIPVLPEWKLNRIPVFALLPAKLLPAKTRIFVEFLVSRMRKLVAELG